MTKQMILQGGPLDGEKQVVLDLNTTPGYSMQFSLDNFQNFHADGVTVASQGLVAVYTFLGPGPAPNPASPVFDTWDTSWIYKFTGEVTIPPPSPITPPVVPPQLSPAVFMLAGTSMTVNANDPGPGVLLVAESILEVDATATSVGYATLAMVGETSMSITRQTWQNQLVMAGAASLTVDPTWNGASIPNLLSAEDASFEGGTTGDYTNIFHCTIANSTAQASLGTHSVAMTCTSAGDMYCGINGYPTLLPAVPGQNYMFRADFRPASTVRQVFALFQWLTTSGAVISSPGNTKNEVAGQWTTVISPYTAPAGTAFVSIFAYVTAAALGEVHYFDNCQFGPIPVQ